MNPAVGQYVKCILRNNTIIEGIVESWTDQKSILKTLDNLNILIIQRTAEDIMVVKIVLDQVPVAAEPPVVVKQKEIRKKDLEKKFVDMVNTPPNPYDPVRNKSLVDLKKELDKEEKEIIANKLRNHHIGDTGKVEYGFPRFYKKPSAQ